MSTLPLHIQVKKPTFFKRHFEFYINDEMVGELHFENLSGRTISASFKEWRWEIKKSGFWKRIIEITAQQSPYTKYRIEPTWNGKLSVRTDSRNMWLLKPIGFWKRSWAWFNENNNMIIELKSKPLSKERRGNIILHQPVNEEMFLLIYIGWVQLIACEDHAAAAAT